MNGSLFYCYIGIALEVVYNPFKTTENRFKQFNTKEVRKPQIGLY